MGYSCTQAADKRLDMIMGLRAGPMGKAPESTNMWYSDQGKQYFYEIGRENRDGAITGSIYKMVQDGCKKSGTFRIESNGQVTRFPCLNSGQKRAAKATTVKNKHSIYLFV